MNARRSLPSAVTLALGAALFAAALPARAQSCSAAVSGLAFGTYNPLAALPSDSSANLTVTCTAVPVAVLFNYTVALSSGGAGSFAPRRLSTAGGSTLQYQLYTNATRTTVWGDGSGSTSTLSSSFLLSTVLPVSQTLPVYGRVPAGQGSAAPGSYSDTVLVTVSY